MTTQAHTIVEDLDDDMLDGVVRVVEFIGTLTIRQDPNSEYLAYTEDNERCSPFDPYATTFTLDGAIRRAVYGVIPPIQSDSVYLQSLKDTVVLIFQYAASELPTMGPNELFSSRRSLSQVPQESVDRLVEYVRTIVEENDEWTP